MTHPDPKIIASHLDNRRLNKQITEAIQIVNASLFGGGWQHHPAVVQWNGHEQYLARYAKTMIDEWWTRGYSSHGSSEQRAANFIEIIPNTGFPVWWGDPEIVRTHQSNLVRKNPEHYGPLFPDVPDDLPYIWPSQKSVPTTTVTVPNQRSK